MMIASNSQRIHVEIEEAIEKFYSRGFILQEVAEGVIRCSAIWITANGGPCCAPGHADRVEGSGTAWYISFGNNTFDIARAIRRCCLQVRLAVKAWYAERPISTATLREWMRVALQNSIASAPGRYYKQYPLQDTWLVFGATAIDTDEFIRELLRRIPVTKICIDDAMMTRESKPSMLTPSALPRAVSPIPPKTKKITASQSSTTPKNMKRCPHCDCLVKDIRFDRHIEERCPKTAIRCSGGG